MRLQWSNGALDDLTRLYEFLTATNQRAAAKAVGLLVSAPSALLVNPRLGRRLHRFDPREARRLVVKHYELRYEIQGDVIYVLRFWHTREDR